MGKEETDANFYRRICPAGWKTDIPPEGAPEGSTAGINAPENRVMIYPLIKTARLLEGGRVMRVQVVHPLPKDWAGFTNVVAKLRETTSRFERAGSYNPPEIESLVNGIGIRLEYVAEVGSRNDIEKLVRDAALL